MTQPTARQVLDAPMDENDAKAATVRGFLVELLATLWEQRDEFDGKRPFGYSDWWQDVYGALVRAGLVEGQLDTDGVLETVDEAAADRLVTDAIRSLNDQGTQNSA